MSTTGLVADNIEGDLTAAGAYTSPTNIGGYLWSTVVARDLKLISKKEARERMGTTLATLATMERHEPSGMYYNWYSPADGAKLTTWPRTAARCTRSSRRSTTDGSPPRCASSLPRSRISPTRRARSTASMDFGWYHDLNARPEVGINRGGFWVEAPPGCSVPGNYADDGPDVYYTCHWYDTTVSESRIATYLGIANGQIPAEGYYGTLRTMPEQGCDWAWQEQKPTGEWREYLSVPVYESVYEYRGMKLVPAWGGSMFEALMPDLFIPEAEWGAESWRSTTPRPCVRRSSTASTRPATATGASRPRPTRSASTANTESRRSACSSDGYASDVERTNVDMGYEGCRDATNPTPDFGDGVVTPHAAFLALPYAKDAVLENLAGLEHELGAYGPGGFYDSVAVGSGTIADRYLSLDQSMIMAAIGNELKNDRLKEYFVDDAFEAAVRPLVEALEFGSELR